MKVAIVGSRDYTDLQAVWNFVERLASRRPDAIIISGGARGVDTMAACAGRFFGLEVIELEPEWARLGKAAGHARNSDIVAAADILIAFWDGTSTGTKDSIDKARQKGIKVKVFEPGR